MSQVADTVKRIQEAAEGDKRLPELARRAGVPYTTLIDWKAKGWRPKAVVTLEKLADAADAMLARDAGPRHGGAV